MARLATSLIALAAAAALATPAARADSVDALFGPFATELRTDSARCDWVNSGLPYLDEVASFHRHSLHTLELRLSDDRGDARGAAMRRVDAVRFRHYRQLASLAQLVVTPTDGRRLQSGMDTGSRLELGFRDADGRYQPLFCGVSVRIDARPDKRFDVIAIAPTQRSAHTRSRKFQDMNSLDIASQIAGARDITLDANTESDSPSRPVVRQRRQNDFTFLRQLLAAEGFSLTLGNDSLRVGDSSFTGPPRYRRVVWRELRWHDIVAQLADSAGLTIDTNLTDGAPVLASITQSTEGWRFAQRLAHRNGHSVYRRGEALVLRADGAWRDRAGTSRAGKGDELLLELAIQGGSVRSPRFSRRVSETRTPAIGSGQARVSATLTYPAPRGGVAQLPDLTLANADSISRALQDRLNALPPAGAGLPGLRRELLDVYQPSLHQLYRVQPGQLKQRTFSNTLPQRKFSDQPTR